VVNRANRRLATALWIAAIAAGACGTSPVPASIAAPSVGQDPAAPVGDFFSPPALSVMPALSDAGGFDRATISDDGRIVTLEVIGGGPWSEADPLCTQLLTGWAGLRDGALVAAVVDITPARPSMPPNVACDLVGHLQLVRVPLAVPYPGWLIRELRTGHPHLLRAPDRALTLGGLAPAWSLASEEDATSDERWTVPVWRQTWTKNGGELTGTGEPGQVDLYMGFGAASGITGTGKGRAVSVAGRPGLLFRDEERGELVVVWMAGDDGLAIVANGADFREADLLSLAEGVARR
jgi:hypothetical protein